MWTKPLRHINKIIPLLPMYLVLYYCIDKIVLLFYTNTLPTFSCPFLLATYSHVILSSDGNLAVSRSFSYFFQKTLLLDTYSKCFTSVNFYLFPWRARLLNISTFFYIFWPVSWRHRIVWAFVKNFESFCEDLVDRKLFLLMTGNLKIVSIIALGFHKAY